MNHVIRDATTADLPAVLDLLNASVVESVVVYTETPFTLADRLPWFQAKQTRGFPLLVAESAGDVVGYATYGDFRDSITLPGFRFTVEHSVHVARAHHGAGLGRALVEALIRRAGDAGVHVMVGAIDASNVDSIRFHERLGFVETARMPEVGHKFGRRLDLVFMQRTIV